MNIKPTPHFGQPTAQKRPNSLTEQTVVGRLYTALHDAHQTVDTGLVALSLTKAEEEGLSNKNAEFSVLIDTPDDIRQSFQVRLPDLSPHDAWGNDATELAAKLGFLAEDEVLLHKFCCPVWVFRARDIISLLDQPSANMCKLWNALGVEEAAWPDSSRLTVATTSLAGIHAPPDSEPYVSELGDLFGSNELDPTEPLNPNIGPPFLQQEGRFLENVTTSTCKTVYRGDSRPPAEIFPKGFPSREPFEQNHHDLQSLKNYLNVPRTLSSVVSFSTNKLVAANFATRQIYSQEKERENSWVYKSITTGEQLVDVNDTCSVYGINNPYPHEFEVVALGGLWRESIIKAKNLTTKKICWNPNAIVEDPDPSDSDKDYDVQHFPVVGEWSGPPKKLSRSLGMPRLPKLPIKLLGAIFEVGKAPKLPKLPGLTKAAK